MKTKTFWKKYKRENGSLLVEIAIATALFAITALSMAVVLYPFLFGSQEGSFQSHLRRLQIEALQRMLDKDYNTYTPIFAFEGEIRDFSGRWINPGPITLSQGTWAEIENFDTFKERALINNQPLTFQNNTGDADTLGTRWCYTLLFFGPETAWDTSNRQIVYVDVLYRTVVSNIPDGSAIAISYETERVQRAITQTNQDVVGPTHHITFVSKDYAMDAPDQVLPYFKPWPTEGGDLIEALFPNPFSQSVRRQTIQRVPGQYSTEQTYYPAISLRYRLHNKGPQSISTPTP